MTPNAQQPEFIISGKRLKELDSLYGGLFRSSTIDEIVKECYSRPHTQAPEVCTKCTINDAIRVAESKIRDKLLDDVYKRLTKSKERIWQSPQSFGQVTIVKWGNIESIFQSLHQQAGEQE